MGYEVLEQKRAYQGMVAAGVPGALSRSQFVETVSDGNARPEFSNQPGATDAVLAARELMRRCWAADPSARPTFAEVSAELHAADRLAGNASRQRGVGLDLG